jgi:DNA-binding CsgD family transcriptional regulator
VGGVSNEANALDWNLRATRRALTGAEMAIAELVARGLTNREVAAELRVSPKTVEWNLTKIYRVLDVRSRTELAAQYAQLGRGDTKAMARAMTPLRDMLEPIGLGGVENALVARGAERPKQTPHADSSELPPGRPLRRPLYRR